MSRIGSILEFISVFLSPVSVSIFFNIIHIFKKTFMGFQSACIFDIHTQVIIALFEYVKSIVTINMSVILSLINSLL